MNQRHPSLAILLLAASLAVAAAPAGAAEEPEPETRVIFRFTSVGNYTYTAAFDSVDVQCPAGGESSPVKLAIEPDSFREVESAAEDQMDGAKQAFGMVGQVEQALRSLEDFELVITPDATTLERRGRRLAAVRTGEGPDLGASPLVLEGRFSRNRMGLGNPERPDDPSSLQDDVIVKVRVDCG